MSAPPKKKLKRVKPEALSEPPKKKLKLTLSTFTDLTAGLVPRVRSFNETPFDEVFASMTEKHKEYESLTAYVQRRMDTVQSEVDEKLKQIRIIQGVVLVPFETDKELVPWGSQAAAEFTVDLTDAFTGYMPFASRVRNAIASLWTDSMRSSFGVNANLYLNIKARNACHTAMVEYFRQIVEENDDEKDDERPKPTSILNSTGFAFERSERAIVSTEPNWGNVTNLNNPMLIRAFSESCPMVIHGQMNRTDRRLGHKIELMEFFRNCDCMLYRFVTFTLINNLFLEKGLGNLVQQHIPLRVIIEQMLPLQTGKDLSSHEAVFIQYAIEQKYYLRAVKAELDRISIVPEVLESLVLSYIVAPEDQFDDILSKTY